ncbi:hypothetical protein [Amycolatopsis nigrescens]|uniref:hypothetical protein n=1 Tax=Amycolatopsis nigrescens TaxID=381445 RepID=UPI00037FDE76|nr:hypothetical protein [Amycolatopsis nigrescens]
MTWADDMAMHSATFREIWRENSLEGFGNDPAQTEQSIRDMFIEFASGDPDSTNSIMNYLRSAMKILEQDESSTFDSARSDLADWRGDAAREFDEYLGRMKDAVHNVRTIIDAALRSVEAYQELLSSLHNDVNELVEQTHDALDKVAEERADRNERMRLTILRSVVEFGAGLVTGGATGALAAAGNALATGPLSKRIIEVGGSTEGDVILDMVSQGRGILDEARESRYRVEKALYEVTVFLTDAKPADQSVDDFHPNRLRPARPAIITDDEFDQDQFHPDDQPARDRRGVRDDDLVAEPEVGRDHERDHFLRPPENKVPKDKAEDRDVVWIPGYQGDPDAPDEPRGKRGPDIYDENATSPDGGLAR